MLILLVALLIFYSLSEHILKTLSKIPPVPKLTEPFILNTKLGYTVSHPGDPDYDQQIIHHDSRDVLFQLFEHLQPARPIVDKTLLEIHYFQ